LVMDEDSLDIPVSPSLTADSGEGKKKEGT
jgi:hypothetical protein